MILACFSLSCGRQNSSLLGTMIVPAPMLMDNDITVGCETLDRDYADYDSYKEWLSVLGIRKIRLQAGWAKTERVKGVYDFAWLDSIIDDAVSRGLKPWLQTSYGNPIYAGGGTPFLKGGWPESEEALDAWHRWVAAMASRYKGKVCEWEIWNEPDLNTTFRRNPESFVDFTLETARTIRSIDPEAKIATLAWAGWRPALFRRCMSRIAEQDGMDLIDWITYHYYTYRPEDMYTKVTEMQDSLSLWSSSIKLRQGETGAPSKGYCGGALDNWPWDEVSQAKWDLRRMLSDKARNIPTTVFSISDMNYGASDAIVKGNVKGLLETDSENRVVRPKEAFWAVRNLVALWNVLGESAPRNAEVTVPGSWSLYSFRAKDGELSYALWEDSTVPSGSAEMSTVTLKVPQGGISNPVAVDVRTGEVHSVGRSVAPDGSVLLELPAYDSPVLIVPKKKLHYRHSKI